MANVWKKTKEIARQGLYLVKNKDEVQKRVLETTRDDDDQITENEYLTIAHLTYDAAALSSIRKTLWKRFIRLQDCPASCRKALQVLDYLVRFGSPTCREMAKNGIGELQMIANSHHFSSDKPREYMNEDQCRNLVQNFLAFLNNDEAYKQARQNGQSTIQRAESFYVEPLQVKIKSDNGTTQTTSTYYQNSGNFGYGGNNNYGNNNYGYNGGNSYGSNTNTYGGGNTYGNSNQSSNNNSNPYTFNHNDNQSNQQTNQQSAGNQIDWSSDDELDEDPRLASKQGSQYNSQNTFQQGSQGGYQQQQQSNPFQQGSQGGYQQQQQSNPFQQGSQGGYQQQQSSPFQSQSSQGGYQQQQSNPFQQGSQGGYQQQQSNPFQSQSSQNSYQQGSNGAFQHQQSDFSVFNSQPQTTQQNSYQASQFSSQPNNQQFGQQQSQFQAQNYQSQPANFFPSQPATTTQPSYQQQNISADEMLFGSPSKPAQQQQQQYNAPQPDPAYDGILDFSNIPMQQRGAQPAQQNKSSGGMLDEFGDLVDLNLQKKPLREHGRPEENIQRGYGNNRSPSNQQYNSNQYNQYNQNQYNQNQYNQYNQNQQYNQYNQRPY